MQAIRRRLLLASMLGGSGVLGHIRHALADTAAPVTPGFRRISGDVRINDQKAIPGAHVGPGDTISTAKNAEAVYVIGQDAFLLRAASRVEHGRDSAHFLRVLSGRILSVFGPGEKNLHVPAATIGIRGTACYIEAAAERTYFCLCYGSAEITPTRQPTQVKRITTRHHDLPMYLHTHAESPFGMEDATVINHWDAELIMLEALQGREPPFGTQEKY